MTIELNDPARQELRDALRRYFDEEWDQDIGDLKADLLLSFILEKIGPGVYNQAVLDAETFMQEKVLDMGAVLHKDD